MSEKRDQSNSFCVSQVSKGFVRALYISFKAIQNVIVTIYTVEGGHMIISPCPFLNQINQITDRGLDPD